MGGSQCPPSHLPGLAVPGSGKCKQAQNPGRDTLEEIHFAHLTPRDLGSRTSGLKGPGLDPPGHRAGGAAGSRARGLCRHRRSRETRRPRAAGGSGAGAARGWPASPPGPKSGQKRAPSPLSTEPLNHRGKKNLQNPHYVLKLD